jgi:hypothetical protein
MSAGNMRVMAEQAGDQPTPSGEMLVRLTTFDLALIIEALDAQHAALGLEGDGDELVEAVRNNIAELRAKMNAAFRNGMAR